MKFGLLNGALTGGVMGSPTHPPNWPRLNFFAHWLIERAAKEG